MLASGKNAMHDITSTSYRELPDRQNRDVYKPQVLAARKARDQGKEASKNRTATGVFLIEGIIKWNYFQEYCRKPEDIKKLYKINVKISVIVPNIIKKKFKVKKRNGFEKFWSENENCSQDSELPTKRQQ